VNQIEDSKSRDLAITSANPSVNRKAEVLGMGADRWEKIENPDVRACAHIEKCRSRCAAYRGCNSSRFAMGDFLLFPFFFFL